MYQFRFSERLQSALRQVFIVSVVIAAVFALIFAVQVVLWIYDAEAYGEYLGRTGLALGVSGAIALLSYLFTPEEVDPQEESTVVKDVRPDNHN